MTTNPGAGTPAKQPAGAAEASGSELSPQATANTDTPETAPLTGHIAPPDDLRQLEAEIERTREQLGETVQELVTRADVKSLARAKATELRERVKDTTSHARKTATTSAVGVRGQVADKTTAALQKATSAGATQTEQLRNRAVAVSAPAWQATPEQVRRAVTNGASGAKEGWIPLTLAASSLILGYLGVRRLRRFQLLRAPSLALLSGLGAGRRWFHGHLKLPYETNRIIRVRGIHSPQVAVACPSANHGGIMAATGAENSLPVITLKDLKDAADRGPIYVMLVFGGGAIAAAVSVQAAASKFNTAEFIATIAVGVALIFGAGVLFLVLMMSHARTLMEISRSSSATAVTGMGVMKDAIDKLSQQDGMTQRDIAKGINLMAQYLFVPAGVTPGQDQQGLPAS